MTPKRLPWLLALLLLGCVPVPPGALKDDLPRTRLTPAGVFPDLDPGAKEVSGLHFQVRAYGTGRAEEVLRTAEAQYNRIMTDTGLYSFMPPGLYSIVVYGSSDEFHKKTQQPQWSAGLTLGNAIYTYEGTHLPMITAHEMTHLIFHEYMGAARLELRWLNEGLAVYEESASAAELGLAWGSAELLRSLRERPIPFGQMAELVPATERERSVSLWYLQVGDVVRFMIERGGRNGFAQLIKSLRDGARFNEALAAAFPGVWTGLPELESAWRRET